MLALIQTSEELVGVADVDQEPALWSPGQCRPLVKSEISAHWLVDTITTTKQFALMQ